MVTYARHSIWDGTRLTHIGTRNVYIYTSVSRIDHYRCGSRQHSYFHLRKSTNPVASTVADVLPAASVFDGVNIYPTMYQFSAGMAFIRKVALLVCLLAAAVASRGVQVHIPPLPTSRTHIVLPACSPLHPPSYQRSAYMMPNLNLTRRRPTPRHNAWYRTRQRRREWHRAVITIARAGCHDELHALSPQHRTSAMLGPALTVFASSDNSSMY